LTLPPPQDNIKSVINHIFEKYHPRIQALGERPGLRAFMAALTTRWEQNNEPPPPETAVGMEEGWVGLDVLYADKDARANRDSVRSFYRQSWAKTAMDEDDYFNASSDEEIGPKPPQPLVAGHKRKRVRSDGATTAGGPPGKKMAPGGLGLDYDDASDSDSSDSASPKATKRSPLLGGSEAGQALAPSPLDLESGGPSPRIKLKVPKASLPEALGEVAMKMSQKRQRAEEEEDEGGLAGLMSGGRPGTPRTMKPAMGKDDEPRSAPKSSNALSTAMRETSKKIKLNLGFGKKDPNNKVV
jgi:protein phosphatase-4 regulatory subunit 3